MREITVTVPVIHDAVGEVFCDPRKLGQFFDGSGIDVNGSNHVSRLDVRPVIKVLHSSNSSQTFLDRTS